MKKAIAVLATNMDYLKALIDNLPKLDCDLIICNESRIGNKIPEIKKLAPKNTIIVDIVDVVKEFAKMQDTPFLHDYTMGMKILFPWYVFKFMNYDKVVISDEDVILNEKINNIFNEDKCLFYTWKMSAATKPYDELKGLNKEFVDELDKLFNLNFNKDNFLDIWLNSHIAAGNMYFVKNTFDLKQYEDKLLQFYRSDVMQKCWDSRLTSRGRQYTKFGIDEWFESFFAYSTNILNNGMAKYVYIEIARPAKRDISKYKAIQKCGGLWHNATVSNKLAWIEELRKYNIIK